VKKSIFKTRIDGVRPKKTHSGATVWWLIKEEDGAPNFELRYFEIESGMSTSGNPHFFEHEVYVLRGTGKILGEDDETVEIAAGDALLIPPRVRHKIVNTGNVTLGFLCAIPKGKENEIK
jgi:quercetin dioxygenase-like cupin family protein